MGEANRRGTLDERAAAPRGKQSNHGKTHGEWTKLDFLARTVWASGNKWRRDPNATPPGGPRPKFERVIRVESAADLPDPNVKPNADQRS